MVRLFGDRFNISPDLGVMPLQIDNKTLKEANAMLAQLTSTSEDASSTLEETLTHKKKLEALVGK